MAIPHENEQSRHWQAIVLTLRGAVVLQCLGNWRWLTQIEETPFLHWMLDPADIGGLAWQESTAMALQQIVGWSVLVAAAILLWRPFRVVLIPLVVLQVTITFAMWQIAEGYPLQSSWISPRMLILFPFATQLLRIAAPAALCLLVAKGRRIAGNEAIVGQTMQLLRWAVAIVFLAHGIEAVQLNPKFVDLIICSTQLVLGINLPQEVAERCLAVIGIIDILLAAACCSMRSLTVIWWITAWGGITAFSRIAANGWQMSWHESFTRISHFGVPLAVALWWHLLKSKQVASVATSEGQSTPTRSKHGATITT